jgi:hypothetical protein
MKDDTIKFRIGKKDKKKFLAICKKKHLVPSNLLWHYCLEFIAKGEEKLQEKIKEGVNSVSGKISSLLTPTFNHYEPNITTF